jgi:hypothetical protein
VIQNTSGLWIFKEKGAHVEEASSQILVGFDRLGGLESFAIELSQVLRFFRGVGRGEIGRHALEGGGIFDVLFALISDPDFNNCLLMFAHQRVAYGLGRRLKPVVSARIRMNDFMATPCLNKEIAYGMPGENEQFPFRRPEVGRLISEIRVSQIETPDFK